MKFTRDDIVKLLESYKNVEDQKSEDYGYHGYYYSAECKARKEALDEAIKIISTPVLGTLALEAIKSIIDMPNTIIQEDVLKYKLICEVISTYMRGEDHG